MALHNYEAEMALLGAIFANNLVLTKVSHFLRPDHFADGLHGRIYAAAARRIEAGQLCNALTLKAEFENDPALVDVGGGGKYLARLAASVVTILNAEDYGIAVHDLGERRALLARLDDLKAAAVDPDKPLDETVALALHDLAARSGSAAPHPGVW